MKNNIIRDIAIQIKEKEYKKALNMIESELAITIDEKQSNLLILKASCHLQLNEYQECINTIQAININNIKNSSKQNYLLLLLAKSYAELENYDLALSSLSKRTSDDRHYFAKCELLEANILIKQNLIEEALICLNKIEKKEVNHLLEEEYYILLGLVNHKLANTEMANFYLTTAFSFEKTPSDQMPNEPIRVKALNILTQYHIESGDFLKAYKFIMKLNEFSISFDTQPELYAKILLNFVYFVMKNHTTIEATNLEILCQSLNHNCFEKINNTSLDVEHNLAKAVFAYQFAPLSYFEPTVTQLKLQFESSAHLFSPELVHKWSDLLGEDNKLFKVLTQNLHQKQAQILFSFLSKTFEIKKDAELDTSDISKQSNNQITGKLLRC